MTAHQLASGSHPPTKDGEDLAWRLAAIPDARVHAVKFEGRLVAFKVGYAIERTRYLSWLGGVREGHCRQGWRGT